MFFDVGIIVGLHCSTCVTCRVMLGSSVSQMASNCQLKPTAINHLIHRFIRTYAYPSNIRLNTATMVHPRVGISALALVVFASVLVANAQPYFYEDYHYSDLMDDYQVRVCVSASAWVCIAITKCSDVALVVHWAFHVVLND